MNAMNLDTRKAVRDLRAVGADEPLAESIDAILTRINTKLTVSIWMTGVLGAGFLSLRAPDIALTFAHG